MIKMKHFRKSPFTKAICWLLVMALFVSSFSELAYAADTPAAVVSEDEVTLKTRMENLLTMNLNWKK